MRTFVAIELNDALREALTQAISALEEAGPPFKLKWVAPQNQHLTLQFLGEIEARQVGGIAQALQQAVVGIAPFEITLAEIGCFPNIHKPNVLWVGVREPSGALKRLAKAVGAQLEQIGFPLEARGFTPHLTLARVPRHANARERRALGEWFIRQSLPVPQTMRVSALHLMRSELFPSGPRYTPLHVSRLREQC